MSNDAGATWRVAATPPLPELYEVAVPSDHVILTSGLGAVFGLSADAGATWSRRTVRGGEMRGLASTEDGSVLMACGSGGSLLQSEDAGESWQWAKSVPFPEQYGLVMDATAKRIWVCGPEDLVAVSRDRGASWSFPNHSTGNSTNDLYFSSGSGRLWTCGDKGFISRSDDEGATWTRRPFPIAVDLLAIRGDLSGSRLWTVGDSGAVGASLDGGGHWNLIRTGFQGLRAAYVPPDGDQAWVGGDDGIVAAVRLDGRICSRFRMPSDQINGLAGDHGGLQLWAVGTAGAIYHSNDSGYTWAEEYRDPTLAIDRVVQSDDSTLAAIADSGIALRGAIAPVHLPLPRRSRFTSGGSRMAIDVELDPDTLGDGTRPSLRLLGANDADYAMRDLRDLHAVIEPPARSGAA